MNTPDFIQLNDLCDYAYGYPCTDCCMHIYEGKACDYCNKEVEHAVDFQWPAPIYYRAYVCDEHRDYVIASIHRHG